MALEINGFAVLRSIAAHTAIFSEISADVNKAARALILKKLKSMKEGVKTVRDVRKALSDEAFGFVVDGMTDAEVRTIIGKLDKHHPELKTSNAAWRRQQLRALADGSAEPTVKIKKPAKPKSNKRSKAAPEEPERLSSAAMAAVRKR
jgi:hypothetical protein